MEPRGCSPSGGDGGGGASPLASQHAHELIRHLLVLPEQEAHLPAADVDVACAALGNSSKSDVRHDVHTSTGRPYREAAAGNSAQRNSRPGASSTHHDASLESTAWVVQTSSRAGTEPELGLQQRQRLRHRSRHPSSAAPGAATTSASRQQRLPPCRALRPCMMQKSIRQPLHGAGMGV